MGQTNFITLNAIFFLGQIRRNNIIFRFIREFDTICSVNAWRGRITFGPPQLCRKNVRPYTV